MNVTLTTKADLTTKELALVLATSNTVEFAAFWMEFSAIMKESPGALDDFAKALSPQTGSARVVALKELVRLSDYYREEEKRKESHDLPDSED